MKKLLLLAALVLTACGSSDSKVSDITTYEECIEAKGEIRYNEPHECWIFGDKFYENKPRAKFIDYGPATGYHASPVGGGPYKAVVLVHAKWGLENDVWVEAREFAKEGYVVLAVDLFDGVKPQGIDEAFKEKTKVSEDLDTAFENIAAAAKWLSLQYNTTEDPIAITGGSFGDAWDERIANNELGLILFE